jgi:hypothetical protein
VPAIEFICIHEKLCASPRMSSSLGPFIFFPSPHEFSAYKTVLVSEVGVRSSPVVNLLEAMRVQASVHFLRRENSQSA